MKNVFLFTVIIFIGFGCQNSRRISKNESARRAANEFTPQQTMRGKQALYSYLYALSKQNITNEFKKLIE